VSIPTADQAAEIAQLRRECDRLRMERDILKTSISIFAGPLRSGSARLIFETSSGFAQQR
jgi:transposase-like protein